MQGRARLCGPAMSQIDFRAPRLFVRADLAADGEIDLDRDQASYLATVLRMKDGDGVLAFNGRDGEWRARLVAAGKKSWRLLPVEPTRAQPPAPDLHYLFAPLKQARLDYMVQKAVEMGVGHLRPVLTRHGHVTRVNLRRMEANAIEAAEQCGILSIPEIDEPAVLDDIVDGWGEREGMRRIVFCDEGDGGGDPLGVLAAMPRSPLAVLVGPEGGFAADERAMLRVAAVRHGRSARPPHPARRHGRRGGAGVGPGSRWGTGEWPATTPH